MWVICKITVVIIIAIAIQIISIVIVKFIRSLPVIANDAVTVKQSFKLGTFIIDIGTGIGIERIVRREFYMQCVSRSVVILPNLKAMTGTIIQIRAEKSGRLLVDIRNMNTRVSHVIHTIGQFVVS